MTVQILVGDVRERLRDLPDASVHAVVTSPPYFNLRDYQTAEWRGGDAACDHVVGEIRTGLGMAALGEKYRGGGKKAALPKPVPAKHLCPRCGAVRVDRQIGSEATPAEYIATMVEVFREVRRVLRDDGTLWLNLGDSYANSHGSEGVRVTESDSPSWHGGALANHPKRPRSLVGGGFKAKDLMMIPARVALALQADGWFLRQMLPWVKRNPMPESAKDRPTTAVEYVFMLTKSPRYFYDYEAVKRKASEGTNARLARNGTATGSARAYGGTRPDQPPVKALAPTRKLAEAGSGIKNNDSMDAALAVMPDDRAFRNSDLFFDSGPFGAIVDDDGEIIALDVTSQGYSEAHFATFPPKLVEPLIIASTSEAGCCSVCGAPVTRDSERVDQGYDGSRYGERAVSASGGAKSGGTARSTLGSSNGKLTGKSITLGWSPSCSCGAAAAPSTVLDPFGGAGTTGLVADRLGRVAILIELNPGYAEMARERLRQDGGLFADITVHEAAQ